MARLRCRDQRRMRLGHCGEEHAQMVLWKSRKGRNDCGHVATLRQRESDHLHRREVAALRAADRRTLSLLVVHFALVRWFCGASWYVFVHALMLRILSGSLDL